MYNLWLHIFFCITIDCLDVAENVRIRTHDPPVQENVGGVLYNCEDRQIDQNKCLKISLMNDSG